jgi:hypothetical protein
VIWAIPQDTPLWPSSTTSDYNSETKGGARSQVWRKAHIWCCSHSLHGCLPQRSLTRLSTAKTRCTHRASSHRGSRPWGRRRSSAKTRSAQVDVRPYWRGRAGTCSGLSRASASRHRHASGQGTRSASENFIVAMTAWRSVPCHHGQTRGLTTGHLGTDPTRSANLSAGPRSTGGRLRRHEAGATSSAPADLAALFTSSLKRPTPASPSASPSGKAPSWWPTWPCWPYAHFGPCGRCAGVRGSQAWARSALPDALRGR